MRDFLQRNITLVSGVTALAFVIIFILLTLLIGARELQLATLERIDKPTEDRIPLVGRDGNISTRSKRQIDVMLSDAPRVLGAWVLPVDYPKDRFPIVHTFAADPIVIESSAHFKQLQASPNGRSSDSYEGPETRLRNSEEARNGLILCAPIKFSAAQAVAPMLQTKVKMVCRATIPPFDENSNMAIIVFSDIDIVGEPNNPAIQIIRRTMLQLQIDIFNRDWQGRETWPRG